MISFKKHLQETKQFTAELPMANNLKAAELLYNKMTEILEYQAGKTEKLQLIDCA